MSFITIQNRVTSGYRLALPGLQDLVSQGLSKDVAKPLLQLTQECWAQEPSERPTMAEVASRLSQLVERLREECRREAIRGQQ